MLSQNMRSNSLDCKISLIILQVIFKLTRFIASDKFIQIHIGSPTSLQRTHYIITRKNRTHHDTAYLFMRLNPAQDPLYWEHNIQRSISAHFVGPHWAVQKTCQKNRAECHLSCDRRQLWGANNNADIDSSNRVQWGSSGCLPHYPCA